MSKFTKKLDQARLKFFGSRKTGKKMKHNGSGDLEDEEETYAINSAYQNNWNNISQSANSNQLMSLQQYQQQYLTQFSQQGIFSGSISGSYLQNQSNWVIGGISGNCTCPLCVGGNSSGVVFINSVITQSKTPNLPRDPNYNNDLGWRCWSWCTLEKKLFSPIQNVLWPQAENHAHKYDESSMVRGVAGIHARFVPENWEELQCPDGNNYQLKNTPKTIADNYLEGIHGPNWKHRIEITGLVERFGKFVEGTEGWRSEWAIIRKLYAPSTEIGLSLEQAFPEVEVIYPLESKQTLAAE